MEITELVKSGKFRELVKTKNMDLDCEMVDRFESCVSMELSSLKSHFGNSVGKIQHGIIDTQHTVINELYKVIKEGE